jgi:hypothetical protein
LTSVGTSPAAAGAVPPPSGAGLVGAVLLIVALAAAVTVDVVQAGYGVKGDEATYVSMALSVAYDHDLTYQRRDLERYWGLFKWGPDGLFLKRGKKWHASLGGAPPFLHLSRSPDPSPDRLYFGKAFVYSVAASPFVRFLGLNGLLVFNVLLLYAVGVCGFYFLAARGRPAPALAFTLAFLGASVVPVYVVFLTSDLFNFAIVFVAYFCWLYKEVAPREGNRFLRGFGSDLAAAVLLGVATFSKPINAPLAAPLVLLWWARRRMLAGSVVAVAFAAAAGGLFGINALQSGEFSYQGGDRRIFYGHFPFDSSENSWNHLAATRQSVEMVTNDADAANVLDSREFTNRFAHNVEYFLVGRHFGFVPYFFPGFVALCLWLFSRSRLDAWRALAFGGLVAATLVLLLFFPYSWSGGGGPPGNRYFLNLYPVLFFLTPPLASVLPPIIAWIGGALFTAQMTVNPFVAAKFPYRPTERGAVRRLPVELTMANDLPVMLDVSRAHVPYQEEPTVLLYFLDEHAYLPEPASPGDGEPRPIWVSGAGRSDIIVRTERPVDHLRMTADSRISTLFIVSAGGPVSRIPIVPDRPATFDVRVAGVRGLNSYEYLLSVQSTEGFTEHLRVPTSTDMRNLGVMMRFSAVMR